MGLQRVGHNWTTKNTWEKESLNAVLLWELLLNIFYHLLGFCTTPAVLLSLFCVLLCCESSPGRSPVPHAFCGGPLFSLASAAVIQTRGFWTAFNSCSLVDHLLQDIFGSFLLSFSRICQPAVWPNGLKPRVFSSLKLGSPPDFSIVWVAPGTHWTERSLSSWSHGENSSHRLQPPQRRLPWTVPSLPSPVVSTISYLGPHSGLTASSFLLLHLPLGNLWHQMPWHVTLVLSLITSVTPSDTCTLSVGIQGHPPSNRPTFPTSLLQTPLPVSAFMLQGILLPPGCFAHSVPPASHSPSLATLGRSF